MRKRGETEPGASGGQLAAGSQIAPIFRLLGEGRIDPDAVDMLVTILEAEGLPPVPAARLARAERIPGRARWTARLATLRWLTGTLVYDSAWQPRPAGVRGVASGSRRLLFTVGQYEVVIRESQGSREGVQTVVGQVLRHGDPVPNAAVVLEETSRCSEAESDVDREGCFRLPDVVPGGYRLDILVPDGVIVCAPVAIG